MKKLMAIITLLILTSGCATSMKKDIIKWDCIKDLEKRGRKEEWIYEYCDCAGEKISSKYTFKGMEEITDDELDVIVDECLRQEE